MVPYSSCSQQPPNSGGYMTSMMPGAAMASYPAMIPVGSQPLPPHGPVPASMAASADPAVAQAEAQRLAAAAAQDVGAQGERGTLLSFRPRLGENLLCSCPMVALVNAGRGGHGSGAPRAVPLETTMLRFDVTCHISQAFVELLLVVQYPNMWPDLPCVFFLPKSADTTITELEVRNEVRPSVQTTMVVPIEDFRKYGGKRTALGGGLDGLDDPTQKLDPDLFMLPITNTAPGDRYVLRVKYFYPLQFDTDNGRYVLQLPTVVPQDCLPSNVSVKTVLEVSVAIDTVHAGDVDLSVNYPYKEVSRALGSISIDVEPDGDRPWPLNDLLVQYSVWRDAITAVVQVEAPAPTSLDGLGTFVLSVMPPGPESSVCFPRDVVFVFDRSGSMTGEPMRYAKAALLTGLLRLDPMDRFAVVAFDHDQQWWMGSLVPATPENIRTCMLWVNDDISARGTTDIKTPLSQALRLLQSAPNITPGEVRLPLVFLLTDGCVDNERDICQMANSLLHNMADPTAIPLITVEAGTRGVDDGQLIGVGLDKPPAAAAAQQQQVMVDAASLQPSSTNSTLIGHQPSSTLSGGQPPSSTAYTSTGSTILPPPSSVPTSNGYSSSAGSKRLAPRIFTFGIGPYCNHYFLKRLAVIGRGMNEVAFRAHAIQASMEQMLAAAALPILSDLELHVPGLTSLTLFPSPLPDVFVGQPLLVTGKFIGTWPEQITLVGTMPSGEVYRQEVATMPPQLPMGALDSIFAKGQLDQLVAEAWLQNNPPAMVEQILSLSLARNIPVTNYTVAVGFETTPQRADQMKDMTPEQRRKHLVKYAIGGAAGIVLVAGVAAALAFGSLAATAANAPIADLLGGADMGDIFSSLGDMGDCCAGCGECCGECGDVCGSCITC